MSITPYLCVADARRAIDWYGAVLALAGALAVSPTAFAQDKGNACQTAFARNKSRIELLAAKPGAQTSRTRQGEYPTRPGRPPPFR